MPKFSLGESLLGNKNKPKNAYGSGSGPGKITSDEEGPKYNAMVDELTLEKKEEKESIEHEGKKSQNFKIITARLKLIKQDIDRVDKFLTSHQSPDAVKKYINYHNFTGKFSMHNLIGFFLKTQLEDDHQSLHNDFEKWRKQINDIKAALDAVLIMVGDFRDKYFPKDEPEKYFTQIISDLRKRLENTENGLQAFIKSATDAAHAVDQKPHL